MAYRLRLVDAIDGALDGAIRRLAVEQTDAALDDVRAHDDLAAAVHDCRKRCKKVRGLVRLVRPALGDQYGAVNRAYRDAARVLSPLRDAHALAGTFDDLVAGADALIEPGRLDDVIDGLHQRAAARSAAVRSDPSEIHEARGQLETARAAIDEWHLDETGWDAIGPGVAKTYGRGRDACVAAADCATAERFHELRKRVKYTWYHLRLLRDAAPWVLAPLADRFHDLSDGLGDAHDLAVLGDQLRSNPDAFGGDAIVGEAVVLADGFRQRLERRSLVVAARLYAEEPDAFAGRLGAYWAAWRRDGTEPRAVGLSSPG